jgi:CRP-like cAMP-binding protein
LILRVATPGAVLGLSSAFFGTQYALAFARLRVTSMALSVPARLARLLLECTASAQPTEYGIRIHVSLTDGEIGECGGTCRESVTRILGDMQRNQIVNLRGSNPTVMNRPALEACADLQSAQCGVGVLSCLTGLSPDSAPD